MASLNNADENLTQFVLLKIDNIYIGVPQTDIVYVENASQVIDGGSLIENSSGQLHYSTNNIPVYTLNNKFKLSPKLNSEDKICAVFYFTKKNQHFVLMCKTLEKYELQANAIQSTMPEIMKNKTSPINGFLKKDNELILLCSAESFNRYIKSCETISKVVLENA